MKLIVTPDQAEILIYHILATKKLVEKTPLFDYGIILAYPNDKKYGVMRWKENGDLIIYDKLINEIIKKNDIFGIKESDIIPIIGKWFRIKYNVDVKIVTKFDDEHMFIFNINYNDR